MMQLFDPSALAPEGDLAAALEAHRVTIANADLLRAALDCIDAQTALAEQAAIEAKAALASAIVQAATGDSSAPTDAQRRKMQAAVTEAAMTRDAHADAHADLGGKLLDVEQKIARAAEFGLDAVPEKFAQQHIDRLLPLLRAHIEATLWPVVLQIAAFAAATESSSAREFLHGLRVPGVGGTMEPPIIDGGRLRVGTAYVDSRTAWRDDPELVALHDALNECVAVRREVTAYTPRARSQAEAVPYVKKGYTDQGITRDKLPAADALAATPRNDTGASSIRMPGATHRSPDEPPSPSSRLA